jgi:hypothetical protein
VAREDALYDAKDHLANVESFFKNQVTLFDDAAKYVEDLKNDLDYIAKDQEANDALNQMRLITHIIDGKPFNYKRIPELNELKAKVMNSHNQMLDEKRAGLKDIVVECLGAIHEKAYAHDEGKQVSEKADNYYTQQKERIDETKSLALLEGFSVQLWNYRDDALEKIEALIAPPVTPVKPINPSDPPKPVVKKIIKPVARQQLFPAKTLTSDEEIDAYVENIRKQMKQYLQGSDGIKIN